MPDTTFKSERKEVASFMRRLYKRGLTTSSGGNISIRISEDLILITPSGTDKGLMKWKEVGIMNLSGENLTPGLKPSMESGMHTEIYKKQKDIKAIIHAHPVFASSFTATKCCIDTNLTSEAAWVLGTPVLIPYSLMGTSDLARAVSDSIQKSEILLLENHGVVTTGRTLLQAFDRVEVLENAAKMTFITGLLKKKKSPLSKERLAEIEKLIK
jgi:L-fuculose-phosphate aldolase